jgi:hypothetical protein
MEGLMPTTLTIEEGSPSSYPAISLEDLTPISFAPVADEDASVRFARLAWQRIEGYTAFRWCARSCVFVIEGTGEWNSPLKPFTATNYELWADSAWVAASFAPSPLGGVVLDGAEMFRVTGQLGSTTPPAQVIAAVRRLAEFLEGADNVSASERCVTRQSVSFSGLSFELERPANWMGKAMQQSGAADLLRPYRRA